MLLTVLSTCFFELALCCYALTVSWDEDIFIFLSVLNWTMVVTTSTAFIFDLNLLIFHIFLICTGQSTYRYVKKRRLRKKGGENK